MFPLPPASFPISSYLRPGYYYLLNHYSSSSVRESQFGHRTGDYQHDNARVIRETRSYFRLCQSDVRAFNIFLQWRRFPDRERTGPKVP